MSSTLRFGTVSAVHTDTFTVDVVIGDFASYGDELGEVYVETGLHMLARGSGDFVLPGPDAHVAVLIDDSNQGGIGVVLGVIYNEASAPPTNDRNRRVIGGIDVRIGDPEATAAVALATKVGDQLAQLKQAIQGWHVVPNDGGAALLAALTVLFATWPGDTGAEHLKAK